MSQSKKYKRIVVCDSSSDEDDRPCAKPTKADEVSTKKQSAISVDSDDHDDEFATKTMDNNIKRTMRETTAEEQAAFMKRFKSDGKQKKARKPKSSRNDVAESSSSTHFTKDEREERILPGSYTYAILMSMYKLYKQHHMRELLMKKEIVKMAEEDADCKLDPKVNGRSNKALRNDYNCWSKYKILVQKNLVHVGQRKFSITEEGVKRAKKLFQKYIENKNDTDDEEFHKDVEHT